MMSKTRAATIWSWGRGIPPDGEPTPAECERAAVAAALDHDWTVRETAWRGFLLWCPERLALLVEAAKLAPPRRATARGSSFATEETRTVIVQAFP